MKKILLILLIGVYTANISAAEKAGQGRWYRFTSDFINDCIQSVNDAKGASNETSGKTVSGINAPPDLSSCLSSSPYLDSETQIKPTDAKQGCKSRSYNNFILPSGSNNQKIELLSNDQTIKSTFKCSSGNWSILSGKTVDYSSRNCESKGVKWTEQDGVFNYLFTGYSHLSEVERGAYCFSNLPTTASGNSIISKSITDMGEGYIKFKCENGVWLKESNSTFNSSCQMNYCQNNQFVSWVDERIKDTGIAVGHGSVPVGSVLDYFANNENLKDSPICTAKVSASNRMSAIVNYYKNDKRLFPSREDAVEKSKIIEGKGYFKCKNGRWEVDSLVADSLCQRKTSFDCKVKYTVRIGGVDKKMYECGVK